MAGHRVLVAAALLVAAAALPLYGQAPGANPPRVKAPRAPGAPPPKSLTPRQLPSGLPGAGNAAAGAPTAAVTPQATVVAPAAPSNAFTAGLAMPPFSGTGDAARYLYLRTLAHNIDSATVLLVDIYRNTSGQPMAGASAPTALSARERERWTRCRDLYWDFNTFASGLQGARERLPANPALQRAAASLDTALAGLDALGQCDNVASMISAPARWDPWAQQYETAARHFYADWYTQVREAHERDRALVVALNAVLPAGQTLPVPPGLPRTAPYAGAVIR
jgi:hypothetical protein